jgi:hypothetical protein
MNHPPTTSPTHENANENRVDVEFFASPGLLVHTPGPWGLIAARLLGSSRKIPGIGAGPAGAVKIVAMFHQGGIPRHYDALLLVAAPDLLAALRELLEAYQACYLDTDLPSVETCNRMDAAHEAAQAALAKAEGRRP